MSIYHDRDSVGDIGFVYVWINRTNGRYYIGSHKGTPDDGYIGSGKAFLRAVKKYGIESFDRVVDYIGPDFRQEETDLIRFFDAVNCPLGYNIMHNHEGYVALAPEAVARIAAKNRGRKMQPEVVERVAAKNRGRKRGPLSEEHRANLSAAAKGKPIGPHSEERRRKMSEAHKARCQAKSLSHPVADV